MKELTKGFRFTWSDRNIYQFVQEVKVEDYDMVIIKRDTKNPKPGDYKLLSLGFYQWWFTSESYKEFKKNDDKRNEGL